MNKNNIVLFKLAFLLNFRWSDQLPLDNVTKSIRQLIHLEKQSKARVYPLISNLGKSALSTFLATLVALHFTPVSK